MLELKYSKTIRSTSHQSVKQRKCHEITLTKGHNSVQYLYMCSPVYIVTTMSREFRVVALYGTFACDGDLKNMQMVLVANINVASSVTPEELNPWLSTTGTARFGSRLSRSSLNY